MHIYISGSLAYDRIMDFPGKFEDHILPDKVHMINVSFVVNGIKENFGGTAGNIAYSLALLEENPTILATAGKDFDQYEMWLEDHGIDISGIKIIEDEFTAGAYITTDMADNQITGFNPGAMKFASDFEFAAFSNTGIGIISPGNLEDMIDYSRKYKEMNMPYIFDPGQQIPALKDFDANALGELINRSKILISNDYELDMIKDATGFDETELLNRTTAIIVTLGDKGSMVITRQEKHEINAVKTEKVVDPTGAGDAYRAGLIKGLMMGKSLKEAAQIGATCAGYSVECYGTQTHRFDLKDFWKRYQENFG